MKYSDDGRILQNVYENPNQAPVFLLSIANYSWPIFLTLIVEKVCFEKVLDNDFEFAGNISFFKRLPRLVYCIRCGHQNSKRFHANH